MGRVFSRVLLASRSLPSLGRDLRSAAYSFRLATDSPAPSDLHIRRLPRGEGASKGFRCLFAEDMDCKGGVNEDDKAES